MLVGIVISIASFVTLILPVISNLRTDSRLNRRGYVFMISAIFALGGGFWQVHQSYLDSQKASEDVVRILNTVQREALRLNPSDFQLRIWATTESPRAMPGKFEPKPVYAYGTLGEATVMFQILPLTPPEWVGLRGRRVAMLRYFAPTFTIDGLEKYPYIKDLDGKILRFAMPLYLGAEPVDYIDPHIELYVRGMRFDGSLEDDGSVIVPIKITQGSTFAK